MKNKIKLSQKTKINLKAIYVLTGSIFFILSLLIISYYFLSDRTKVLAADGDGTCGIVISSEEEGYNKNFQPYQIKIEAEILNVIPSSSNCQNGYNFNLEVAYNISFEGPGKPNINTLQGNIICDNYNLWFNFPNNVRNNGGSGTFVTSVNPWRNVPDCNTITPEYLGCNAITITISGEGIPAQSNLVCPINTLLPVSLVDLYAEETKEGILLKWVTVSEVDNDYFTVERSNDGKIFETIVNVDGAGDSSQKLEYEFLDTHPGIGFNYYRLKQTDYNGDFEYFKIISVNNDNSSNNTGGLISRKAYPIPFNDQINLSFETDQKGSLEVVIHNIQGERVHNEIISCFNGVNNHNLTNLDHLQSGVYFLQLQSGRYSTKPQRLVKL